MTTIGCIRNVSWNFGNMKMKIMKIKDLCSPNFERKKRSLNSIKALIIHYTGMQSERESIIKLKHCSAKTFKTFIS